MPRLRTALYYFKMIAFGLIILSVSPACSENPPEETARTSEKHVQHYKIESPGSTAPTRQADKPPEPLTQVVEEDIAIKRAMQAFTDDLTQMRKRRMIRALVSYSKSNYFMDKGVARGFEYELLQEYEKQLNNKTRNTYDKIKLIFIPVPFNELLTALEEGRGDIAAAGLTVTPERQQVASFTAPYIPEVAEVVVRNESAPPMERIQDLAGQEVYVRAGSSYITHLEELNIHFREKNLPPVKIIAAPESLGTEDILEMVHAGVVKMTVTDQHIAQAWAQVLPGIRVEKDIHLHSGGQIAWAVRKENPELLKSLNGFIKSRKKGTLLGNILFKRYYQQSKWINNPLAEKERQKLEALVGLFEKYSDQYGFEWLAIAAQAYQESGFDHSKKSPSGAVGIMQLLPSTAAGDPINIKRVEIIENNVHAGVKYLDFLRKRYFSDPAIAPADQVDFTRAAYNAGPAKINRLRGIAAQRGLDPNRWFYHVERIAAEKIGRETVSYVANINKYYVAYKLYFAKTMAREKALQEAGVVPVTPANGSNSGKKAKPAPSPGSKETFTDSDKKATAKYSLKRKTRNPAFQFHTVSTGDTMYSISRKYGLTVQELSRLNQLGGSGVIHPGDRLLVRKP